MVGEKKRARAGDYRKSPVTATSNFIVGIARLGHIGSRNLGQIVTHAIMGVARCLLFRAAGLRLCDLIGIRPVRRSSVY